MHRSKGKRNDFLTSMGWFLPLFSFGFLLLLTGSKAEVKELMEPQAESEHVRTVIDEAAQAVPVKAIYTVPDREETGSLDVVEAAQRQDTRDGPAWPAAGSSSPPSVPTHP